MGTVSPIKTTHQFLYQKHSLVYYNELNVQFLGLLNFFVFYFSFSIRSRSSRLLIICAGYMPFILEHYIWDSRSAKVIRKIIRYPFTAFIDLFYFGVKIIII